MRNAPMKIVVAFLFGVFLINFVFATWTISPDWTITPDWIYDSGEEDTFTLSLTITNPQNTTYTNTSIPVSLSVSGNETNPVYSWNFQFSNGSWLYGSNQTGATGALSINYNATGTFCCVVTGDHGASDYETVGLTVELHLYSVNLSSSLTLTTSVLLKWTATLVSSVTKAFSWIFGRSQTSIYIVSPANTTYTASSIPVQFNVASDNTIHMRWWNIKNGTTWVYPSNQTYTGTTTATNFVSGTSYTFYAWANDTLGNQASSQRMFSVDIYYWLTMNSPTAGGIVNPVAGSYNYSSGTNVTLIATANAGYSFVAWELNGVNETTAQTVWYTIMDMNHTAKAYFKANTYVISTSVSGFGSISRNASEPYTYNQIVQLTAVPSDYQKFTTWGGDLTGATNPQSIIMSSNRSVSAAFDPLSAILTVALIDPLDNQTIDAYTANLIYYPVSRFDSITGASLYINGSAVAANSTTVLNATLNGFQYTFPSNGTYVWNVLVSNSTTSVFALLDRTLRISVYEPSTVAPSQPTNFYYLSSTHTVNGITGYNIALVSGWSNASNGGQGVPETAVTQYGFRAWLVHSDGSADALTGESVIGIITRESTGQGMQNATFAYIPPVTLVIGFNAIKISAYVRFDYGEWMLIQDFISDRLVKKGIEGGTWTFNVYTKVEQYGGSTYAYLYWGNQMCLSGLGGVVFVEPLAQEVALARGSEGDFIGMMLNPYLTLMGDLFYGMSVLFVGSVIYLRNRKWEVIVILAVLWLGVAGVGTIIPGVAYRIINIILLFVIGGILYRLFR